MADIPERRKTGRRKADEELRLNEKRYRLVVENASDIIWTFDLSSMTYSFVSPAVTRILGYSVDEAMGMQMKDVYPTAALQSVVKAFDKLIKGKIPGDRLVMEVEHCKKGGEIVWTEVSSSPIRDDQGKIIGVSGVTRDITDRKKMEEALRQSEEKYRTILKNMQEGYFEVDLAGNLTFVNDAMCEDLRFTREELIGMNSRQYTDEENAKKLYQIYNTIFKTGAPVKTADFEFVRKDGTKLFAETSASLITDAAGNPIGFRGVSRDVTERRQAEEAHRKSEEKYRNIIESIQEGYIELDLAGNFTFINDAQCRSLRYSREELMGMNYRQYTDKETTAKLYEAFNGVYRTERSVNILDFETIRKDGTKMYAEISVSLIKDAKGNPIGFRGISRDVTERKQAESQMEATLEALRQSEKKYRTILEEIEEGYFELDLAGNATFFNDSICRIFGYPREEYLGVNYKQYTDEENQKKCFQMYNKIYKTGQPGKIYEYEIIRKDGAKRHLESSVSLQKDSAGKVIGFRGVSRDITERKQAEEALKKTHEELVKKNKEVEESRKNIQLTLERLGLAYEELKNTQAKIIRQEKMASIGQIAAGVAHEINNPMAFIASNLGTLDKYIQRLKEFIRAQSETIKSFKATDAIKKLEKKRKELKLDYTIGDIDLLVKESVDGTERVNKIVQGLNRFSRVNDEEYKDTNINECIESSINIVWNELKNKATLHKDYGNLPHTKCYPLKLNQVFINLLINAIQAIEKKGKIEIKTWEKDGSIWVAVSDTGYGISKENQSKIFEPFFTTKEAGRGTGLGLSISYDIIQRHKGEISFKSKKGKGATFTIRIPIV